MICPHERIKTWLLAETHEPAGMWSCAHCGEKFLPITAALAEKHAAVKRCREIVPTNWIDPMLTGPNAPKDLHGPSVEYVLQAVRDAIREAFPQAFDGLPTIPKG